MEQTIRVGKLMERASGAAPARSRATAGQGTLAATFAIVALISGTLNYVWD